MSTHTCGLCEQVVEQIIKLHVHDTEHDASHTTPIPLGSLDELLAESHSCPFFNFILRIHDQVRPSYAIAPARGMPECSARNTRTDRVWAKLVTAVNPNAPSGERQIWSNFIDFVDENEIPVSAKWRAMFRLIADDVSLVRHEEGHQPTELGRLLDPFSACDPMFWGKCFGTCLDEHKDTCGVPDQHEKSSILPDSMRVLDLVDQMIKPFPFGEEYAVLSYVWGPTNSLLLTQSNFDAFCSNGSLLDSEKPKTIYDAMIVAQSVGIRYLWVDALCIIQDDEEDKMQQVHRMGQIYTNAALTIVGARAGHADGGLWSSEHRSQLRGEGGGLRWISAAPILPDAIKLSAWAKRAWTYQEGAFSRRTLFFTEHQAYYSCKCSAWAEDYVRSAINGSQNWEYVDDDDPLTTTIDRLTSYPESWSFLLGQYTNRRLTFESDVLIASAGVISSYLQRQNDVALCGLPVGMLFEFSLLWMPVAHLTRRTRPKPNEGFMFPSWSWAGWSGAVGYDGTDHLYRPHIEAARIIQDWRFQCDDLKNRNNTLSSSDLREEIDHFLSTTDHHTSGAVSLQTVQQGTLIINTLEARLRVGRTHWNQFMGSDDITCKYTGYYKLYKEDEWIGSIHLEHHVAKVLGNSFQEVIALSTTGGRGPARVAPLPHFIGQIEDDAWLPLCDPKLIEHGDSEMYNVMLVEKKTHYGRGRYRVGVGQVHKTSFDRRNYHKSDIWLE